MIYCLYKKDQKGKDPMALIAICDCLKEVIKISQNYIKGDWYSYQTSECGKYLYDDTEDKINGITFSKKVKKKEFDNTSVTDWSGRKID